MGKDGPSCGTGLNRQYEVYVEETGQTLVGRTSEFQVATIGIHKDSYVLGMIRIQGIVSLDREKLEEGVPSIRVRKASDVEEAVRYFGFEDKNPTIRS